MLRRHTLLLIASFYTLLPVFMMGSPALAAGTLIKASGPAVYYLFNSQRLAFPNEAIYKTWYNNFSQVSTVSDEELSSYPLTGVVKYRPGVRLVKITTDPNVYAVGSNGELRWITSEEVATALYGSRWNQAVDDLPDAFFSAYRIRQPITLAEQYSPSEQMNATPTVESNFLSNATTSTSTNNPPVVNPPPLSACTNDNKTGGNDGAYAICAGDRIYHQPSNVYVTLLSADSSQALISVSNLPGGNTLKLTVAKGVPVQFGGNNNWALSLAFNGINSNTKTANVTISSFSINANNNLSVIEPPAVQPPQNTATSSSEITPIQSTVQKKFLTLIYVNNAAGGKYEDNVWERTIDKNSNNNVQILEVTMWDNINPSNPKRISLYKFDSTFDPSKPEYTNGGTAWVQYREQFNVLNIELPNTWCAVAQAAAYYDCSASYRDAFKKVFSYIAQNNPAEHYGIKYGGHGTSIGLFENRIADKDAHQLLAYFNAIIGKKIDFLDWSTQCTNATFGILNNQYQYTDYILASDLLRNPGTGVGGWPPPRPESMKIISTLFSPQKPIRQSLIDMYENDRLMWSDSAFTNYIIANKWEQSMSIFDTTKFEALKKATNLDQGQHTGDVLHYITNNYPTQIQSFNDFRFDYVSTKNFFPWTEDTNGFKF